MPSYKVAKLIKLKNHFKCESCGKHKHAKMYEYQGAFFIASYIPKYYKEICEDCIYKTIYGPKNWKTKKRERSLDDSSK